MNRVMGVAIVVAALGIWGGIRAWQSASVAWNIQAALAIVIGGNLILCLWVWRRARPGSGDAMVIPTILLLSAAMLVGILPRVFWPTAEGIHIGGSIASLVVTTVVLILQIRQRRSHRRGAGPA